MEALAAVGAADWLVWLVFGSYIFCMCTDLQSRDWEIPGFLLSVELLSFALRVGVALILPKFIGENGIFYAEICAWSGAAVLLILSYGIIIQKHKNKTDVRYIPMKTAQGYIGQKKISSILIYTFLYLMFHDFPTLFAFFRAISDGNPNR